MPVLVTFPATLPAFHCKTPPVKSRVAPLAPVPVKAGLNTILDDKSTAPEPEPANVPEKLPLKADGSAGRRIDGVGATAAAAARELEGARVARDGARVVHGERDRGDAGARRLLQRSGVVERRVGLRH